MEMKNRKLAAEIAEERMSMICLLYTSHVRVDEYMKRRLQSRLIRAILNSP